MNKKEQVELIMSKIDNIDEQLNSFISYYDNTLNEIVDMLSNLIDDKDEDTTKQ